MPNVHFIVQFCKCQKSVSTLPHETKALLELFCLQPIIFGERKNSSSSYLLHEANKDWIGLVIFKNLRIRTGSDSILSDQDWTRTEKNFTVRSSLDFTQSLLLLKRYRLQKSANFIETNLLRYLSISCKLYKNQPA